MPAGTILFSYQERILSLQATAAQLRHGQMIAMLVMIAAFVAMGALAVLAMAKRTMPLGSALVPLPLAVYAGRTTRRRRRALLDVLRLETFYQGGVGRLEGSWRGGGPNGEGLRPADHPYAKDLDVFGDGSLFELLCTCRSEVGRRNLGQLLLAPPDLVEARRRQDAVRELRQNVKLREQVCLLGEYSFQESSWSTFTEWLESPVMKAGRWFRLMALTLSLVTFGLFVAGKGSNISWERLAMPMAGSLLLSGAMAMVYRRRLLAGQPAIRALSLELGLLRQGLEIFEGQAFESPLLKELAETVAGAGASRHLRRLERLTHAFLERDKEWFYHASRGLLIGTQVFLAIEKWRAWHGEAMRTWLRNWGEFEALMAIANYAYEHPENEFPEFVPERSVLEFEGVGHPLLGSEACVRNDIAWSERTRFYVISGSNMAGKSTLLRTIGLNVVLAYAGAPVCAARMVLSQLSVCASIGIQDSLLNGKSKFMAEVDRLKQALNVDQEEGPVLFLIDEILSGTNSKDRRTAVEAILRALLERGAMGAISTHDLALAELAALPDSHGVNVHMGSRSDADPLDFDYLIKPGVTNQSSALAIARLAGVSV